MNSNLDSRNRKALDKIFLAKDILKDIKVNPQKKYQHHPLVLAMKDSRWNAHYVNDTLDEVMKIYETYDYSEVVESKDVSPKVKSFVQEALDYRLNR